MATCAEIMTPKPKFHEPNVTVDVVAKTMKDSNVGPVPIVDSQDEMHLIGIVTDRDLALKIVASNKNPCAIAVQDVMSRDLLTCKKDDNIENALALMEKCQIRRIPVVDEDDRLVGIISQADIATRLKAKEKTAEMVTEISRDDRTPYEAHFAL